MRRIQSSTMVNKRWIVSLTSSFPFERYCTSILFVKPSPACIHSNWVDDKFYDLIIFVESIKARGNSQLWLIKKPGCILRIFCSLAPTQKEYDDIINWFTSNMDPLEWNPNTKSKCTAKANPESTYINSFAKISIICLNFSFSI